MDKITLKEWAAMVPYKTKVVCQDTQEIMMLWGTSGESTIEVVKLNDSDTCRLLAMNDEGNNHHGKPLVRPLSSLKKPITHNGETVTVVNLIYEYCAEYVSRYGKNRKVFDNLANTQSIIEYIKPEGFSYTSFKVLLEYHFDVFGLIGRGLALPMEEKV